jgi:hypothetical protein
MVRDLPLAGRTDGRIGHGYDVDPAVDIVWYRVLSGHADVDRKPADQLTDTLARLLGTDPGDNRWMTTPRDGAGATDEQPLPGARLAEELRLLLDALAERAEPMLNRLATAPADEHTPATCGWCPVCAGIAVLRGERPELAVRAAEHAAGLLGVLRAALAERQPTEPDPPESEQAKVQHIAVRRRDQGQGDEC